MINSIQRDQRRRMLVLKYQAKRVQHKTLLQNCKISLQSNKKQLLLKAKNQRYLAPLGIPPLTSSQGRLTPGKGASTQVESNAPKVSISLQRNASHKDVDDFRRSYTNPKVPRNGSATRVRNRCVLTARGRGVLRFCKLSRIRLRELAAQGALNGVSKASW